MKYAEEIVRKHFSHSFMGYDMEEVDFFLDEVIDRFDAMEAERRELLSAMEYLLERVEELGSPEEQDRRRLAAAENTFRRLNATPAQSVSAGPVRVATVKKEERRSASAEPVQKKRTVSEPKEDEPVAIELETGESAPDTAQFVPTLMDEMESILKKPADTEPTGGRKGGMLP